MTKKASYTLEFRDSLIAKALAPNAPSVVELARQHNIDPDAIYRWVSRMKKKQGKQPATATRPKDQTLKFKLNAIFETGPMTEEDCNAYCRTHGLYPHHLDEWKSQILSEISNVNQKARSDVRQAQLETQQAQFARQEIEKDLNKKNKALAEFAALLALQKKANFLWGDNEDV